MKSTNLPFLTKLVQCLYHSQQTIDVPTVNEHLKSISVFYPVVTALSAVQCFVSGNHCFIELDHERGPLVPVDGDLGGEATVSEDGLYDPSSEGCTVQGAVLLRNGDVRVDEWLFFDDVVGLVIIISLLQLICLLPKQGFPHRDLWSTNK